MKKLFILSLAALLAVAPLSACTDAGEGESSAESASSVADSSVATPVAVDTAKLLESIKGLATAKETYVRSADDIFNDLGIDPETYTEGFQLKDSGITEETVAFFKAKDAAAATSIKDYLDKLVTHTLNTQDNYNEDNYYMAKNAVSKISGDYVYLVMSPSVDNIVAEIEKALKG